jgi:hypothetical protein
MVTKTEGEREFGSGRPEHRGKNEALACSPVCQSAAGEVGGGSTSDVRERSAVPADWPHDTITGMSSDRLCEPGFCFLAGPMASGRPVSRRPCSKNSGRAFELLG